MFLMALLYDFSAMCRWPQPYSRNLVAWTSPCLVCGHRVCSICSKTAALP